ncbi:uncharacterized protein NESG_01660 [Nematocida ausubeli]|uniref:separase n=1 Tax=Nematocida ausubeli (strain ATCC PRA-371 / ERTm2) TaxID=1913371 RepID=A0A086J0L3_NEMA1|nr:uncharacterized protein NESG_01660 [Nematocida ausubeli]KFG25681.1 hypothetical protein NESG_01660 [Nematocida ausubeli]
MQPEKQILECSPLLYITDRERLYRILSENYSEQQIKRLFSELQKYNVLYFYKIPSKEELEEIYEIPESKEVEAKQEGNEKVHNRFWVSTCQGPIEENSTRPLVNENIQTKEEYSKESIDSSHKKINMWDSSKTEINTAEGIEAHRSSPIILSTVNNNAEADGTVAIEGVRIRRCFDSYHLRNKEYLYDESIDERSDFDRIFLSAYYKYTCGEYLSALDMMENLLRKSTSGDFVHFGCRLHLLSIGASAAYKSGGYFDALWMCKAGILLSKSVDFSEGHLFFQGMLSIIEATKKEEILVEEIKHTLISSHVSELLNIHVTLEDKLSRCIQYRNEITLLRDVKIYDAREIACSEIGDRSILEYINKIKGIGEKCMYISPIVVYSIDGCIAFGLIYYNERAKMSVIKSKISTKNLLQRLSQIQKKNKEVLKRVCTTPQEKQEWWRIRISLDNEIKKELALIDTYLQRYSEKGHKIKDRVALVIEDILGSIPFEMCNSFSKCGVFRCSSLCHILSCSVETESTLPEDKDFFYVLNPERNLMQTEERISKHISKHLPNASGIRNRVPLPMETEQAILSHRIFMYFGHGGGEKFFTPRKLKRLVKSRNSTEKKTKSIFLFGCSSAHISAFPLYNTHSTCISYMHIPVVRNVVGALWDITDKDLDITSIGIIEAIQNRKEPLSIALNRLKHACKLKYLNGAAIVLYGIDE